MYTNSVLLALSAQDLLARVVKESVVQRFDSFFFLFIASIILYLGGRSHVKLILCHGLLHLSYWGLNKMVDILKVTCTNALSCATKL